MNDVAQHAVPAALEDVAEHPFLRDLEDQHLNALADCAMRIRFAPGELIFRHGDPANRFYLLIKGKVAIETDEGEESRRIHTLNGGEVLGWSWLFPPYYIHFDASALETTDAIFFYGTRFREMCEQNHVLGYEILKRIAKVVMARLASAERSLLHRGSIE